MSLTSLLNDTAVRQRFRDAFDKPAMAATPDLVAPPVTNHPARVGTAFDYLFRFHLKRVNREITESGRWTAEAARHLLSGEAREAAEEVIASAKAARDDYVASGNLSHRLLEVVMHLAELDVIARTGGQASTSFSWPGCVRDSDVADLRKLYDAIPSHLFRADDLCLLNPAFGRASVMVGGADADVLTDDVLIDIKTVKQASFTRKMFDQLLGYYTLHIIGWHRREEAEADNPTDRDLLLPSRPPARCGRRRSHQPVDVP